MKGDPTPYEEWGPEEIHGDPIKVAFGVNQYIVLKLQEKWMCIGYVLLKLILKYRMKPTSLSLLPLVWYF